MRSDCSLSLVYGVKIRCSDYSVYGSVTPLTRHCLGYMAHFGFGYIFNSHTLAPLVVQVALQNVALLQERTPKPSLNELAILKLVLSF